MGRKKKGFRTILLSRMKLLPMNKIIFSFAIIIFLLHACGGDGNHISVSPRELFVCSLDHTSIFEASLSGDVGPLKVFAQATDPSGLSGMTVDVINNEIFVVTRDSITVYVKTFDGDMVEVREISGDFTALSAPAGIAVDTATDEILITNCLCPYS